MAFALHCAGEFIDVADRVEISRREGVEFVGGDVAHNDIESIAHSLEKRDGEAFVVGGHDKERGIAHDLVEFLTFDESCENDTVVAGLFFEGL